MDDNDLEYLFNEAEKDAEKNDIIISDTISQKIITAAEKEFKGYSEEQQSRVEEIKELNQAIKELTSRLKRCKNIKNIRLVHLNKQRSKKRNELKKKIEFCKLRLREIDVEEGKGL